MNYKFLHRVIDQIMSETRIDYDEERLYTTFYLLSHPFIPLAHARFSSLPFIPFHTHCEEVYGLNEQEIVYVWNEYKEFIKDKIKNNG